MSAGFDALRVSGLARRVEKAGSSFILYDDSVVSQARREWFDASKWRDSSPSSAQGTGRGSTFFIEVDGRSCVLRHYYRGGFIGKFLNDEFLWIGLEKTRAFAEWFLLEHMQKLGLPSPVPLAAHVERRGFVYRADLLMERIPEVKPLSVCLESQATTDINWNAVGFCIGGFHREGINHADLNVHNIQIGSDGAVSLVDFDRGRLMSAAGQWQRDNLARLSRSLKKVSNGCGLELQDSVWQGLMEGYRQAFTDTDPRAERDDP